MTRRVVITGMGAITPLGNNVDTFWKSLCDGTSGVDNIKRFDITDYACKIAAELKDFDPLNYMDKKEARRMDRFTQYAMAATRLAIDDAGLNIDIIDNDRFGVVLGTGIGGIETFEAQAETLLHKGPGRVSPFCIPMIISNMAAGQISIAFNAKGPNTTIVTACAASTNAIGEAYKYIKYGDADVIITGGAEAPITPIGIASFGAMRAVSLRNDDPKGASRPFDINRDGFVMGEGSGILILESYEHAVKRNANILAEIKGYGLTSDAYHITSPAPNGEGAARAIQRALGSAGMSPQEIDYINAHGTATQYNDKFETAAIKTIFGEHASNVPISSTKSMTGHLLGAAGAIEAIACVKSIQENFIHPTINLTTPDPECDLDYVPNTGRKAKIDNVLSNSFGFGGHNACIVISRA